MTAVSATQLVRTACLISQPASSYARICLFNAALYSKLSGPYNLRNAYGAIFSHGPVLTMKEERNPLIDSVVRYGFCPGGSLLRAFEFSFPVTRVVIESTPANPKQSTWTYEVECQ